MDHPPELGPGTEIEEQAYLKACCFQQVDQLSLMGGAKRTDRFELNNDLALNDEIGNVLPNQAALEMDWNLGLPNHIDAGLQKVNHQRSLVDGFQETRTQMIVDIIEGAQNHMGDLRVQQILA